MYVCMYVYVSECVNVSMFVLRCNNTCRNTYSKCGVLIIVYKQQTRNFKKKTTYITFYNHAGIVHQEFFLCLNKALVICLLCLFI